MNTGILERIEEQNLQLIAMLTALTATSGAILPPASKAPEVAGKSDFDNEFDKSKTDADADDNADVDVDATGQSWDEALHASTKTKTAKGLWKKRKGAKAPVVGKAPVTPVAGKAPVTPPVSASVNENSKNSAMSAISVIADEHNVPYELIFSVLHDEMSAKTFNELTPDQYPQAEVLFTKWLDSLTVASSEIERIITAAGDQGAEGVQIFYSNVGVTNLTTMKPNVITEFLAEAIPFREQWEAYVESTK